MNDVRIDVSVDVSNQEILEMTPAVGGIAVIHEINAAVRLALEAYLRGERVVPPVLTPALPLTLPTQAPAVPSTPTVSPAASPVPPPTEPVSDPRDDTEIRFSLMEM